MFAGLVEGMGTVRTVRDEGPMRRLDIELGPLAEDVKVGDSIAVNGVCLTVAGLSGSRAGFDVVAETLDRTTLVELESGEAVNIERALRVGDRVGGHFVQGHVDGTGRVARVDRAEGETELHVSVAREMVGQMIMKGSIAIDGVSLTIAGLQETGFHVALVPYTLEVTTLNGLVAGDRVNIELDMLGKYVARLLEATRGG